MADMANINSLTLSQFVDLVQRKFTDANELPKQVMRNAPFVVSDVIPHGSGDVRRYSQSLARTQYAPVRGEGSEASQAEVQYGYEKDVRVYNIALATSISKRMREAGKNYEVIRKVTDLATVCPNSIDLDLAHRFTFAWSTSYTRSAGNGTTTVDTSMGDSLAMISTAHTLTGSSTTWSNQITGNPAFSKGALENAERSFIENSYDNLGNMVSYNPDTILTTNDPVTCNQVRELLNSTASVVSNNSGNINVYKGKYNHIESARIPTTGAGAIDTTKRLYWFLLDSKASTMFLTMFNEPYLKTPMDGNNGESFLSENWNFLASADYGICVVDGAWVRGSKGDGS